MPLSTLVGAGLYILSSKEAKRNREMLQKVIESESKGIKKLLLKERGKKNKQKGIIRISNSYINLLKELKNIFKVHKNRIQKISDNIKVLLSELKKEYGKHGTDEDITKNILKKIVRFDNVLLKEIRDYLYLDKRLAIYKQNFGKLSPANSKIRKIYKHLEKDIIRAKHYNEKLLKKFQKKK